MKLNKLFVFLILSFLPFISVSESIAATYGDALWAKSTVTGDCNSTFNSVAADNGGSSYGAGYIYGNCATDFGNGVAVSGPYSQNNMLLVKYDASGNAVWAKSMVSGLGKSTINAVTTDSNGNVYVAGYIGDDVTYSLGNGITVSGFASGATTNNIFVAKYDSGGNALWAKSTSTSGSLSSGLNGIAVDSSGNVYAVGNMNGNGTFGFGDGVTASGSSTSNNIILLKYDTDGATKWAKTVSVVTTDGSYLTSIALDNNGDLYVGGAIVGTSTFNFGNGVSITGINGHENILLVKYDSSGDAGWAKTVTSSADISFFKALVIDNGGNVFGDGYVSGAGSYEFGDGVSGVAIYSGSNAFLLKYNSTGNAQWAKFPTSAPGDSTAQGITIDNDGNVYMGGTLVGAGSYKFDNNVIVKGVYSGFNPMIVGFNSNGTTLQAKSLLGGTGNSRFYSVFTNGTGDLYAGGSITGKNSFDFGNEIIVNGSYAGSNVLMLKYYRNYTDSSSYPSSSSNEYPSDSSSSDNNTPVISKATAITAKLPKLFAVGGAILLLF